MLFFAKNLKFLRELKGVKQAEMLDLCGFKQSTWNGYERGVSTPNIDDLIRISDFFKVPESYLLHTELNEKNLQLMYRRYKSPAARVAANIPLPFSSGNDTATGMVQEPAEEYSKPCDECTYLQKTIQQKDETIAALHGQIAALQLTIDALKVITDEVNKRKHNS